ncbi:MAG: ABC transporter substrate-binding protein [Cyanobacteria bacterium]|nr:ABC transporter substrate-binding protein [Cyanobacteriota bacterium]MDW8199657.1 ABC transporter substrate-binding protein [Cyanobacteriota bacterium SKYGB_h_bin112]
MLRPLRSLPTPLTFTILSVVIILLCAIGLITRLPSVASPPITLSLLLPSPEIPMWKPLAQKFEQRYPRSRLNLVEAPSSPDLLEDLSTAAFLLGDSPYDLVYMDVTWTPKFAAAGWLQDLSDRITAAELDEFLAADVAAGRYRGHLYRIPVRSDIGVLYYRRDLLQQAGYTPPQTFGELMQIGQTLQRQGQASWGYLWQGRQYEGAVAMFVEILHGFGGFWINPDNQEVGLDRPEAIQAVQFLVSTIDQQLSPAGVITYREEDGRYLFQAGEAVFLRSWPYVWALANKPDSPIQGKFDLVPMVHGPGATSGACKGGWGLGIARTTKHPEVAWQAVQFLTSADSQRHIALFGGYMPTRTALFTDAEIVAKYPHFPQLLAIAQNAVLRPLTPQYAQASDILQRYLSAAFTKRLTPEQAMRSAARETRQLIAQ